MLRYTKKCMFLLLIVCGLGLLMTSPASAVDKEDIQRLGVSHYIPEEDPAPTGPMCSETNELQGETVCFTYDHDTDTFTAVSLLAQPATPVVIDVGQDPNDAVEAYIDRHTCLNPAACQVSSSFMSEAQWRAVVIGTIIVASLVVGLAIWYDSRKVRGEARLEHRSYGIM